MEDSEIKKVLYHTLPSTIKTILLNSNGFLVGSSINQTLKGETIKDYDIIIPDREAFMTISRTLRTSDFAFNTFGGIKFDCDGIIIDIWCEELSHFVCNISKTCHYAYNMKKNLLLKLI